ncbi:MAG TPA: fumarylacetoacetate hydrolase family protein [Propionibacteriaceae bacterium]|nr:fumarylacetoacetate hydrolase family protein [Propionibacteriaceae bacterium]
MKYARVGPRGQERPVILHDEAAWDLAGVTDDIDAAFLASGGLTRAADALAAGTLDRFDIDGLRPGPCVRPGGAVICIGLNYAAHAAESGAASPELPVIFLKTPNTVSGPDDPVQIPRDSVRTDWEVELALVIGSRASYLDSPDQSIDHIAGFTVADDLSERTFQLERSGGQWSKGKCCAGFTPTGPWLVTPDEVDYADLRLRSWVNGEPRQDSSTADLIFDVDYLVWHLSQYLVLEPGDLVLTGTPEGVALSGRFPYLKAGDVVEVEIEGLGRQTHHFVPWQPAAAVAR